MTISFTFLSRFRDIRQVQSWGEMGKWEVLNDRVLKLD